MIEMEKSPLVTAHDINENVKLLLFKAASTLEEADSWTLREGKEGCRKEAIRRMENLLGRTLEGTGRAERRQ